LLDVFLPHRKMRTRWRALWAKRCANRCLFMLAIEFWTLLPPRETLRFRSLSPDDWVEFMKTYFGPAILAFQHSSPEAGAVLKTEMQNLVREFDRGTNGTTLGESEHLDIVAIRR
jgi:hypothetical protein